MKTRRLAWIGGSALLGVMVVASGTPAPDEPPYCPHAGPDASGFCCAANETLVGDICELTVIGEPHPEHPAPPSGNNGGGTGGDAGGEDTPAGGAPADGGEPSDGEEDENTHEGIDCWKGLVAGTTSVNPGGHFDVPREGGLHEGVDLLCPRGRQIFAAEPGIVTFARGHLGAGVRIPGSGGNMIEITYANGRVGRYLHLLPESDGGVLVEYDDCGE